MPAAEEATTAFKFRAEIESDIGRLVIPHVLHHERVTIDRLGKEGVETVLSGERRDVKVQVTIVSSACQHLLSPVADDICTEGRVGLGAIVENAIIEVGKSDDGGRAGEIIWRASQGFFGCGA